MNTVEPVFQAMANKTSVVITSLGSIKLAQFKSWNWGEASDRGC